VLDAAARLVGARADEIALTGSDTQAWTKAMWGYALGGGISSGEVLLVDRLAYNSHYLGLLQVCELTGASIEVMPSTADGSLDVAALGEALGAGPVALVAVTQIGTHRGLVNPVEEMGPLCRHAGVPFFLDACQSVGQLPVDVEAIGCDVLTGTGRKWLRGPRGTGFLYVRQEFADARRASARQARGGSARTATNCGRAPPASRSSKHRSRHSSASGSRSSTRSSSGSSPSRHAWVPSARRSAAASPRSTGSRSTTEACDVRAS